MPIARLRGRRQIIEIRHTDLTFSLTETTQFLQEVMGLQLKPDDISQLAQQTEGWITGLQMAALSLQDQANTKRFFDSFNGNNRFILDYLMEEVWQQQPPEIQQFLLQTAVLEEMCAALCDALVEINKEAANQRLINLFSITNKINLFRSAQPVHYSFR